VTTIAVTDQLPARATGLTLPSRAAALMTLARRRFVLSTRTPREIAVPLLTPIMFALVIAPALSTMVHPTNGLDYKTYVAVGTVGLLVPLSCMFAGIGVIVDRDSGARRELLAAPVPRALMVGGNFVVALVVSTLQLAALMVAAIARGASFHTSGAGIAWFVGAAYLFAVASYGIAEVMANRIQKQEEYVAATPAIAILPWFLAGALFPIHALPAGLTVVAKALPLTHALAVMRYGLLDQHATGLHDIWGMSNPSAMAALSLLVVATWALALAAASVRVFARSAVR
jgi:ABC-type multidrug transport system permease subunit